MKLALVTINYNSSGETAKLIKNLIEQTDKDFSLITVDNASSQKDVRTVRDAAAQARSIFLSNSENLGFSGGNNTGIRYALDHDADWVLLINNDTTVEPTFIAELKDQLAGKEGIVGLPIREGDRTAFGGAVLWLSNTLPHLYHPVPRDADRTYAIGAGVALDRNALEKLEGLDERYFLYFEDADLSERARRNDIPVSFIEKPVVSHAVSSTTHKLGAPLLLRYHYRNMFLFNSLHAPWSIRLILPIWAFFGIVKQIFKLTLVPESREQSRAIFAGILDYLNRSYGRIQHSQDRH